jgi:glutaredoxin 3
MPDVSYVSRVRVEPVEDRTRRAFKEVGIERDPDAARDIVRNTELAGVPVIKIGSKWIVGFDKERIDNELARKAS